MNFRDLTVYRKAFGLAIEIYTISKLFPTEKKHSLTDHIRRPSHSVCSNLAEANRKKQHPKHFISKVSDSDSETFVWFDFSYACSYIISETPQKLVSEREELMKLVNHLILHP